ncbi:MAG TPA: hypothetical protein VFZ59_11355, partial [Verrucomicrobiae bacterium]|nr:hypothetical protein [Verrucomicrobiae bacterium]
MKLRLILALTWVAAFCGLAQSPEDYTRLKTEAEKLYAEGSYGKAHELYARAMEMSNISSNEVRWVVFRNYDAQWRSAAATQNADTTRLDAAREALEKMVRDVKREEDKDRVWVEVQESLGDF